MSSTHYGSRQSASLSGGGALSGVQGPSPWWGVRGHRPLKLTMYWLFVCNLPLSPVLYSFQMVFSFQFSFSSLSFIFFNFVFEAKISEISLAFTFNRKTCDFRIAINTNKYKCDVNFNFYGPLVTVKSHEARRCRFFAVRLLRPVVISPQQLNTRKAYALAYAYNYESMNANCCHHQPGHSNKTGALKDCFSLT